MFNQQADAHFSQATNTPPVIDGIDQYIRHILTQPRDTWQESIAALQPKCPLAKHIHLPPPLPDETTLEDLTQVFRRWKERTTKSPSGRHLGIYKALLQPDHEDKKDMTIQKDMGDFLLAIINTFIKNNIVLTRWKRAQAVLLQNKPKNNRIHRFRSINIYEADFNLSLKILVSKRMMKNAEKLGLPNEQWGVRKERSSGDLGLDNLLTFEYSALTRTPLAMEDLDATASFDRIISPIGVLSLANFLLFTNAKRWMLKTLDSIQYSNVINNRISSLTYPADPQNAHGIVQGLSPSGTGLKTTNHLIVSEYRRTSNPAVITCPKRDLAIRKGSTVFVNYRKLWTNGTSTEDVSNKMTNNITKILHLLQITGGDINLTKSSCEAC